MAWQPDYVDIEDAARYLRMQDDRDYDELADAIAAASRGIDNHANRQFGKVDVSTTFYYRAVWDVVEREWWVDIDDLYDPSDLVVTVGGVTVTSGGYALRPSNAVAKGKPYETLVFTSAAEARPTGAEAEVGLASEHWGWAAIPAAARMACKLQLSRVNWRRDAPAGVAGSPESGSEIRLLARLDADAIQALRGYTRARLPR